MPGTIAPQVTLILAKNNTARDNRTEKYFRRTMVFPTGDDRYLYLSAGGWVVEFSLYHSSNLPRTLFPTKPHTRIFLGLDLIMGRPGTWPLLLWQERVRKLVIHSEITKVYRNSLRSERAFGSYDMEGGCLHHNSITNSGGKLKLYGL